MLTRIIVSSDCQTGGLAASLRELFPTSEVLPVPLPLIDSGARTKPFVDELASADVWVSSGRFELLASISGRGGRGTVKLVKIPSVYFPAFHPDLCYAKKASTNELTSYHYNSLIAVWSYNNRLSVSEARSLFNDRTYSRLGFFDLWPRSVNALRMQFDQTDIDFGRFFLFVKRHGVFMHTSNHPKPFVLAHLAKLVAIKLGADEAILGRELSIPDGLQTDVWPLYPEVARFFALPDASLNWRIESTWILGLESFLEAAFKRYSDQGIAPGDLVPLWTLAQERYDGVLRAQAGRTE